MFPDGKCVIEGKDGDFFFPKGQRTGRATKGYTVEEMEEVIQETYCSKCPRQIDCAEYAIEHGINHGVFGFSSEKRRNIRNSREKRKAS